MTGEEQDGVFQFALAVDQGAIAEFPHDRRGADDDAGNQQKAAGDQPDDGIAPHGHLGPRTRGLHVRTIRPDLRTWLRAFLRSSRKTYNAEMASRLAKAVTQTLSSRHDGRGERSVSRDRTPEQGLRAVRKLTRPSCNVRRTITGDNVHSANRRGGSAGPRGLRG